MTFGFPAWIWWMVDGSSLCCSFFFSQSYADNWWMQDSRISVLLLRLFTAQKL